MKKTFGDMLLRIGLIPLMLLALVATSCELDDDQIPVVRPVPVEDLSVYVISSGDSARPLLCLTYTVHRPRRSRHRYSIQSMVSAWVIPHRVVPYMVMTYI